MGCVIVIEGLDGCGKSTQLELLCNRLLSQGKAVKEISFPEYDAPSSAPVKMYLAGEFGKKADDVNAFAASSFYAVDRFSSYKRNWEGFYKEGGVVVCGRYATSNAIHQASKFADDVQKAEFLDWIEDFEYKKIGIPAPDLVIYLNMPTELSRKMLEARYEGDNSKKDIHERDESYRDACQKAAEFAAKKWGWRTVECSDEGKIRTREDIADEIFNIVTEFLKEGK